MRTARVVANQGGRPPEQSEKLREVPGVGMYTAAAWLSLHRGKRVTVLDSNIVRWLSRMTGQRYNRDPRHLGWAKDVAERLTPRRAFRQFNYAAIDFSMRVCRPRAPLCDECPVSRYCDYGMGRASASRSQLRAVSARLVKLDS